MGEMDGGSELSGFYVVRYIDLHNSICSRAFNSKVGWVAWEDHELEGVGRPTLPPVNQ